jgi:hypothetical protein
MRQTRSTLCPPNWTPSSIDRSILEEDYTGLTPQKIAQLATELVRESDEPGAVIVPILKGTLPAESSRREIDVAKIRSAAQKALIVRPSFLMKEMGISEERIRSIFEGEMKDIKAKSLEYFVEFFSQRYEEKQAIRNAHLAQDLVQLLVRGDEERARERLEEAFDED